MNGHAKLSASGSSRWIACPGSVAATEDAIKNHGYRDASSPFAQEGTCAHELAELVLTEGGSCFDWEGENLVENNAFTVPREMCEYVQQYVDYVKAVGGKQHYEMRVDFSDWVQDGFGTSDAIVLVDDTIHVIDLKYGRGVVVDAENNTQGLLYALGAYSEFELTREFKNVVIHIVQPRLDHISEWSISIADLLKEGERLRQAAELALSDNAPRVAGEEQCRFCPAKAWCSTLAKKSTDAILADFNSFDDLTTANAENLTQQQMREVLENKALIVGWISAIEEYATGRLEAGESFDGFKLVEGRSLRKWADENEAAETLEGLLGDDAYTKSLLSPAQAEKALGKAQKDTIAELINKPCGKPTLVPDSDKRPAINTGKNDFDDF